MMKKVWIYTGITSLFVSCSTLHASEQAHYVSGSEISSKIEKLKKKIEKYQDQAERIKNLIKEHHMEDDNQLYTFLKAKQETSTCKESKPNQLENDIELCRLGQLYFLSSISQTHKRIEDLQTLINTKYLNRANEYNLAEEIKDLTLNKRKYTASDYSDYF